MHVASTRWYLSRVFGRERYCTLPKGGFIEDTLGQLMLRAARSAARLAKAEAETNAGAAKDSDSASEKNSENARHSSRVVDAIREAHRPFGAYVSVASVELESEETGGEGDDDALLARDFVPGFFDPPDAIALPGDVWI
jgi:hypothetical protein